MKGLKRLGLGVAVAGALLAIAAFIAGSVFAIGGSISIGSASVEPGGSDSVDLVANVPDAPGLGAWTADISYDMSVVSVDGCSASPASVCNAAYDSDGDTEPDAVRITGAVAQGLMGEQVLGTITFSCVDPDAEATSPLGLSVEVFSDAAIGNPQPIDPADVGEGSFACETQPTDEPPEEGPTATDLPQVPRTGTGAGDSGNMGWLIVALADAGLFGIASLTALRVSTRRS